MSRILVLPGMGDIYWVAVALRSFCEREGIEDPEVWVWDFDGRRRSLEYVERIPFVRAGGYWQHRNDMPEFHESYMVRGRSVFPDFHGFDFYLAPNGVLRKGGSLEDAFPGCDLDWYFPLRSTEAEVAAEAHYRERFGPYVVAYFSEHGMFRRWVKAWNAEACAGFARNIAQATGRRVVLTGSSWDADFTRAVAAHAPEAVNLCGATGPDEFWGLWRGADGCVGWCGGNTFQAVRLRKPTMILWSREYFPDERFWRNACPPDAWGQWYDTPSVEGTSPKAAMRRFLGVMERCG